ncbi:hypothetical protein E6C50_12755 [Flavobacterium supellecticarium]|uniref:Uncharacterized protein n=1 Tax=Flavobacterium supellecticarium TaxID=2565924 RepID=A0A4V3W7Y3_9FLAO|nr:hypothetical protein [Flavobacterium supellecticarium]THF49108.1 hypothetical protein E6C50_12755 [Flavobacterium supellecticarium]
MKKLLLFVVTLMTTFSAFSQYKMENVSITYGEEITEEKGKIIKIIGETNNKIYALGLKGKSDYFLKIFDASGMKLLSNKPILLPELKDKDIDFEEIVILNGKLYVIGSVYHRKDKIFTLVGIEYSEDGKLSKNMTTMFEAEVAKSSDRGGFYFKVSPDEHMLLAMHTALYEKEDALKYELKMFDPNLKTVFSNIEKVSYNDDQKDYEFTISDFDINTKDDVFLVINESYRDKKKKEKVEKFQVFAFKNQNGYKKEVVDINFTGKEIINCKMISTSKNTVQLVGFYSSVRDNGKANKELKGVYNATINLDNNTNDNLKFNEFDYATKVKLLGERRAKKGKDLKPLYMIHSIIEKNDGGLIVISEYRFIYVGQRQGIGPLGVQPITYTTNEMIVMALKPDGSLDWSNVVAKEQAATVTVASLNIFAGLGGSGNFNVALGLSFPLGVMGKGPEYLSAIPIYKDGQLSILFNDNKKNKGITDIEEIKSLGNYNNAVPTIFMFSDSGVITRKDPEEAIKNELVIRPGIFYRKNEKEFLIYASRKSQDKLGRMVLQ